MTEYVENIKEWSDQKLDTIMFTEIIENSKYPDTTHWTDNELPSVLIVNQRVEIISKKYAMQMLGLTDDKQFKVYKKQINKFNSTEAIDRDLYSFSRPILTILKNTRLFCGITGMVILAAAVVLFFINCEVTIPGMK